MCMVSAIHDQFRPIIPVPTPTVPYQTTPSTKTVPLPWVPPLPPRDLEKVLVDYRKMVELAAEVDEITGQPDCEDPEKATLLERVAELERRLAELEGKVG